MQKKYPYIPPTREEALIAKYGECSNRVTAAKILGVTPCTISVMTRDGRLEEVCKGTRISMTSIARYMDAPAQANFKASLRKRHPYMRPDYFVIPSEKAVGVV